MTTIVHKPQQSTINDKLLDNIDTLKRTKQRIEKINTELTFLERQLFDKKLKQNLHSHYAEMFRRYESLMENLSKERITHQFLIDLNITYLSSICNVLLVTIEDGTKNDVEVKKSKMLVPNINDNKCISTIQTLNIDSVSWMSNDKETLSFVNDEPLQGFRKVSVFNGESFYVQTKEVETYTVESLMLYLSNEIYSLTDYGFFNVINDRLIIPKDMNGVI